MKWESAESFLFHFPKKYKYEAAVFSANNLED